MLQFINTTGAHPWGYYNPLPLFLHYPQCNLFTQHRQDFQNIKKYVGILSA
jgi:hypothetical protein